MDFSDDYLYGNFKKNYDGAIAAKERGNLALAKQLFYAAAEYMEKYAFVASGETKLERLSWAKRMRAVADAIIVAPQKSTGFSQTPIGVNGYNPNPSQPCDDRENAELAEMQQFLTFLDAAELTDGFESVIGLDEVKAAVRKYIINPMLYPDAYNYKFLDNKAILMEGPPGTGKTTFAKALAKEINRPFALLNAAALVNCYVGETAKNIDRVFSFLRGYTKSHNCGITVFIDEFDEIAKSRGGDDKASASAVPALLRNLDGVQTNKGILIVANTNCKDALDKAVAERFNQLFYIPLPDGAARKILFERKLIDVEDAFLSELDFNALSELSDGMSGRDITFVCDDFKFLLAEVKQGITDCDGFQAAIEDLIVKRRYAKK